jgi:neurofibromin 1
MSSNGINVTDSFTTLVEQSITVLRLTVERIQPGTVHKYLDLDEIIFLLARYLSRLGRNEGALRAKMRFCHFAELALRDGHSAKIGTDGLLPNSLLDWLTEWSMETMKVRRRHLEDQ